jgi:hypothetical protein
MSVGEGENRLTKMIGVEKMRRELGRHCESLEIGKLVRVILREYSYAASILGGRLFIRHRDWTHGGIGPMSLKACTRHTGLHCVDKPQAHGDGVIAVLTNSASRALPRPMRISPGNGPSVRESHKKRRSAQRSLHATTRQSVASKSTAAACFR